MKTMFTLELLNTVDDLGLIIVIDTVTQNQQGFGFQSYLDNYITREESV